MMVIAVCLTYLREIFGRLLFFDEFTGGAGLYDTTAGLGGMAALIADGIVGPIKLIFFLAVYVLVAFLTVLYGSQIISEFGEFAMQVIGAQASRYNQAGTIADKTVLGGGLGYMGAQRMAQGSGAIAGGRIRGRGQIDSSDKGRLIA